LRAAAMSEKSSLFLRAMLFSFLRGVKSFYIEYA